MLGLDKVPRTPSGTAVLTSDLLPNLAALRFYHVDVASLPLNTTPEHPAAHERTVRVTANNVPGAEPRKRLEWSSIHVLVSEETETNQVWASLAKSGDGAEGGAELYATLDPQIASTVLTRVLASGMRLQPHVREAIEALLPAKS